MRRCISSARQPHSSYHCVHSSLHVQVRHVHSHNHPHRTGTHAHAHTHTRALAHRHGASSTARSQTCLTGAAPLPISTFGRSAPIIDVQSKTAVCYHGLETILDSCRLDFGPSRSITDFRDDQTIVDEYRRLSRRTRRSGRPWCCARQSSTSRLFGASACVCACAMGASCESDGCRASVRT